MSVSVSMPQLGESVTEGTVTRWLKKEGERVEVDEPLLEVSTDKVDTEIPSPASGILRSIAVDEDETVAVGAQLAVIEDSETSDSPPAQTSPPAPQEAPAPPEAAASAQDAAESASAAEPEPASTSSGGWSTPGYTPPTPGYAPPPAYGQPPSYSQPAASAQSQPYAAATTQTPAAPPAPAVLAIIVVFHHRANSRRRRIEHRRSLHPVRRFRHRSGQRLHAGGQAVVRARPRHGSAAGSLG